MSAWIRILPLAEIPVLGARRLKSGHGDIAIFRNAADEVFALLDRCPHKGGPLSQGIVFGTTVACPLHGWNISLKDGAASPPDEGCTRIFPTKIENGEVWLEL